MIKISLSLGVALASAWAVPSLAQIQSAPTAVSAPQKTASRTLAPFTGWTHAASPNIEFYGQADSAEAKALLQNLENFRLLVLRQINPSAAMSAEAMPVKIVALKDAAKLEAMLGGPDITGTYQQDLYGPAFVINSRAFFEGGDAAKKLISRAYASYLVEQYAPQRYPAWLAKGAAEYFASVFLELSTEGAASSRGSFMQSGHEFPLNSQRWIPMEQVLNAVVRGPDFNTSMSEDDSIDAEGLYAAQSWLAVSYIFSDPKLSGRIGNYANELDAGTRPDKAFKRAFGLSQRKFENRLRDYLGSKAYEKLGTEKPPSNLPKVSIAPLTSVEAEMNYLVALSRFSDGGENVLGMAESFDGRVLAARAVLLMQNGQTVAAQEHIHRALNAAPNDPAVQLAAGELLVMRYNEAPDPDLFVTAKDYFEPLAAQEPQRPLAAYYYAIACSHAECPAVKSVAAAKVAMDYYKGPEFAETNLNLLSTLFSAGDMNSVRMLLQNVLKWSTDPDIRAEAARMLSELEIN